MRLPDWEWRVLGLRWSSGSVGLLSLLSALDGAGTAGRSIVLFLFAGNFMLSNCALHEA